MIVKRGKQVCVVSEKTGRNFGCYPDTKAGRHKAHVRLGQIEAFKKRSLKR